MMRGRRLGDVRFGELPEDVKPGDYWRYLSADGSVFAVKNEPGNLTGTAWGFSSPDGRGIGLLTKHTVREHQDGTITIAPGDGSSNSVLISDGRGSWHGYVDHGVWRAA